MLRHQPRLVPANWSKCIHNRPQLHEKLTKVAKVTHVSKRYLWVLYKDPFQHIPPVFTIFQEEGEEFVEEEVPLIRLERPKTPGSTFKVSSDERGSGGLTFRTTNDLLDIGRDYGIYFR